MARGMDKSARASNATRLFNMCLCKKKYMTKEAAEAHLDNLPANLKKDKKTPLQVYLCPNCLHYHIGHANKKK